MRGKRCACNDCKLTKTLARIAKKCTPKEREALNELWGRMEWAETMRVQEREREE